mgnify:CR=1 FL=1
MSKFEGVRLKKCPLCGGEIEISYLCQYSREHKLTKSGRISKRYKTVDNGPLDAAIAGCRCGANWNTDQFEIDPDGYFIDYKYSEEEP